MLGASVAAQAGASVAINGPAFLIPSLQETRGLSLAQAGTVAAAPIAGVMVTLFLWGLLVDRIGERRVLLAGLGGTVVLGALATFVEGTVAAGRDPVRRRHGRRLHRLGQRPDRRGLVPAAAPRTGHGHAADGPAAGGRRSPRPPSR